MKIRTVKNILLLLGFICGCVSSWVLPNLIRYYMAFFAMYAFCLWVGPNDD